MKPDQEKVRRSQKSSLSEEGSGQGRDSKKRSSAPVDQRVVDMETLVDELMKENPDGEKVRRLMNKHQLAYSPNVLVQIDTVLRALSSAEISSRSQKSFEEKSNAKEI